MFFWRKITVLVAAVAAAAVVYPSAAAAATSRVARQTQKRNGGFGGAPQLTIGGETCQCLVEFLCDASKVISIPEGSKGCGEGNHGLVCCRINDQDPLLNLGEASSESPQNESTQKPYKQSTKNPPTTSHETDDVDENLKRDCVCVTTDQCSVKDYNLPDIDIRINHCGKKEICCNKNDIVHKKPDIPEKDDKYEPERSCGVGMTSSNDDDDVGTRIVSPEEKSKTFIGQYPWMVVILKTSTNPKTGERLNNVFQCGGSLIHPKVVLTAAHCVRDYDMDVLKVRVGEWDTQSDENKEDKYPHEDITISEIVVHPKHHNGSMFNDVALIQLSHPISPKPHINTVCVPPTGKRVNYDSSSCISTGWGKNGFDGENDKYQSILKKVHLSIVPHSTCQKKLRRTRLGEYFILDESFVCAGGLKGVDVCKGDGGGPLVCPMNEGSSNKKKYVQVGIVSWGIGCGDEDIPGVYASLEANAQWIHKQLNSLAQ